VCVYVLVVILKKELKLPQSLRSILQVLSVNGLKKCLSINYLRFAPQKLKTEDSNQLTFNDL